MYQVLVTVNTNNFNFETDNLDNLINIRDTINEILWGNVNVDILNLKTGEVIYNFLL